MLLAETYGRVSIAAGADSRLPGVSVFCAPLDLNRNSEAVTDFRNEWAKLHNRWRGSSRKEVELNSNVQAYEAMYRRMGLDPARHPPSVKGLVTRFLRGDELTRVPAIHPIVDAVNVAAVQAMIPLGVFDATCVEGGICIDLSRGGEPFEPIGGEGVTILNAGLVVLRDEQKVLSIFCSRDGEAQKVTADTRSVWLLGCQVPGISGEQVESAMSMAAHLLRQNYCVEARLGSHVTNEAMEEA